MQINLRATTAADLQSALDTMTYKGQTVRPANFGTQAFATIKIMRSEVRVAPEAMYFSLDLSGFDTPGPTDPNAYNPQLHDLYYFWEFGDPGSQFSGPVNVLAHQRNANVGYGPAVMHTFANPGTYTVKVTVIEPSSGKVAMATLTPDAVLDADVVYAGDRTIFIHPTGDMTNAPEGARSATGLNTAKSLANTEGGPKCRLMLAGGQTFTEGMIYIGPDSNLDVICNEPGGARAIVKRKDDGSTRALFELNGTNGEGKRIINTTLHGFSIHGPWDELTETNENERQSSLVVFAEKKPKYALIHDMEMRGGSFGERGSEDVWGDPEDMLVHSNSTLTSWQGIGMLYSYTGKAGFLGMNISRSPDALAGGGKFSGYNDHGPVRFENAKDVVVDGCDFFNNAGWVENVAGIRTQQPCWRHDQNGNRGSRLNMQRTTFEGGLHCLELDLRDGNANGDVQNVLVERCMMIGSWHTDYCVKIDKAGVTLRNNVFSKPNQRPLLAFHRGFVKIRQEGHWGGDLAESAASPIKVYQNTCILHLDDANASDPDSDFDTRIINADGGSAYTAVTVRDNALHAPNLTNGYTADGPFTVIDAYTPRYDGYQARYERVFFTLDGLADGASVTIPFNAGRVETDYLSEPTEISIVSGGKVTNIAFVVDPTGLILTNNTGGSLTGSYYAVFSSTATPKDTSVATPVETGRLYIPAAGSPLLGVVAEVDSARRDFYAGDRAFPAAAGAFEPA